MSFTVFYIFLIIVHPLAAMWWKSFSKLGEDNWKAFIPVFNYYIVFKHGAEKPWWSLLMLIPGVHVVMWMAANVSYIRRFGYFTLGDTLQGLFFPYLITTKIANDQAITLLPVTNWASPVEAAKRANGDHVILFLSLPVIGHALAYILSFRSKRIGKKSAIKEWGDSLVFAIVAASIIRTYVFEPFQIPTGSMEKTLLVGDFLFVNKLAYGPKVPVTPLSYPLVHNTIPWVIMKSYTAIEKGSYYRLPGFSKINRYDVMVFNFPSGDTAVYDPRVPDGLMGHDYYGVLNSEAIYYWFQDLQKDKMALLQELSQKANEMNVSAEELIMDSLGADFIDKIEYYRTISRQEMAKGVVKTRGNIPETYGLIYRPVDKRENYIKRCVAVAGDWIELKKSVLYVNDKPAKRFPNQNMAYIISGDDLPASALSSMGLVQESDYRMSQGKVQLVFLTDQELNQLSKNWTKTVFTPWILDQYSDNQFYKPRYSELIGNLQNFPKDFYVNNTITDYTKIQIPYKGKVVDFSKENIAWYRRIITAYEGHKLEERKDGIYIDGKKTNTYKIQMNYYWLMGDNRYNSADSRVWGFVPEDHVVGKASIVWFSKGANGIRWDRVFKAIN